MKKPVYQQIQSDIREKILNKELKEGELIPSENELHEMYGVSRMTVRHALNNLVNAGYLYRHKGKGTFVSNRKIEKNIHGVRGFTEEMLELGREPHNVIKSFKVIEPNELIREKLYLEEDTKVIHVERVRYADNIPVLYENLYIPQNIFPDLSEEDLKHSFYGYINDKTTFKISHCIQSIEAQLSNKSISEKLEVKSNDPILSIIRNTFLTNGRPFEYVVSLYRSDQYRFVQVALKS